MVNTHCARPALGEPSRVQKLRAQSPGAASVGSGDDAPGTTAQRKRATSRGRGTDTGLAARHSRDPRPIGDRAFAAQCARNVVEFLASRGYSKTLSHEKLLKDPSTGEFYEVFRFLIAQLDPQLQVEGKMEDEVPAIMKRLKYPVEVNRSKLQAISGPNTWPQLLAVLDWLVTLVHINDDFVEPLAECQLGMGDPVHDAGDHHVLRSLHENYLSFLSGKDDSGDDERLRMIYTERIEALKLEIERLENQRSKMNQQLQDFHDEHERLRELQKAPAQLEVEADRLRGIIQVQEHKVQTIEDEIESKEAEKQMRQKEIEELQAKCAQLAEQVENQAHSKLDVDRLHAERHHLRQVFKDLKSEGEKTGREVWELGMEENRRVEEIGRLLRQVNDTAESLRQTLDSDETDMFNIHSHVDVSETTDVLAALKFDERRNRAQEITAQHAEICGHEEQAAHNVLKDMRILQEQLREKHRENQHLKNRLEQVTSHHQAWRDYSIAELDDALRTAECTEDAVQEMSMRNAAPSLRDAAEVDKLQLALETLQAQGVQEKVWLEEEIHREEGE
eukprot:TRINITY_DN4668_c0_g1_i1.p1 TRINITY_DN4668_c0_g1~~TRINITY_DN4668_c0_g1_i1.p1  ORF type:complete len:578 (+),score=151.12 TRINITY_DN4668_c0_g1_i1:51-1736(+)